MLESVKAIARAFRRGNRSPVISRLYTHGFNAVLCVHPQRGESLLMAYAHGTVETGAKEDVATTGSIAVINISGGLCARPMSWESDECPGPMSYQRIREYAQSARDDDSVAATVLRLDTPGGEGASLFDLTDWIYANSLRGGGKKKIIAVVDDMAFSAGYAIAAACDEIWVTRTGGTGSIGTVCYHVDASGYDQKQGFKITYIYAGKHKVDGNQHEPLPSSVKKRIQQEVDVHYELFVGSVSKYRGMDAQAIRDTEAECYTGPQAITIGLADKLGTLEDALASLANPPPAPAVPVQETQNVDEPVSAAATTNAPADQPATPTTAAPAATTEAPATDQPATPQTPAANAEPFDVTAAILSAGLRPGLTVALQKWAAEAKKKGTDITAETIAARVTEAKHIADACAAAKLSDSADDYVERGTTLDEVRKQLVGATASPVAAEVVTALDTKTVQGKTGLNRQEIYERRKTGNKSPAK